MKNIEFYATRQGDEPILEWFESLDKVVSLRILKRLKRLSDGNYGDFKLLSEGIFELRFFFGAGYRVYCAEDGDTLVILLWGGDKGSQSRDITKAKSYWQDYQQRKQGK